MKIALLGDIGLLGNYSLVNNSNLLNSLNEIANYLVDFDIVIGNLETPFSIKKKTYGAKSSYICTDIRNIEILKLLNITAVNLANNHMYDFGKEGLSTTIKILEEANINWFGVHGKDYRIQYEDNKIVINGFCCYSTNPLMIAKEFGMEGINPFNIFYLGEMIKRNSIEGWLNILSIHSGIEHVNFPSQDQILASHFIGDIAPIIWYGHHPHVIQGIEKYKNSIIAHSLGNFCFAGNKTDKNRPNVELSENNRIGMILELEINNNKIMSCHPTLIYITETGEIQIIDNSSLINDLSDSIYKFFTNPIEYNKYRAEQRSEYINNRKKLRNLSWLTKHLRIRYIKLYLEGRKNNRKYKANVTNLLKFNEL